MKFSINNYIDKVLTSLRAKPLSGGLEISDSSIRFAYFDNKNWQMLSLRLPPNVISGNQILDYQQFVKSLSGLRKQIFKSITSNNQKISAVVSLAPTNVYSQVFNLPIISDKKLDEAVKLNIQMVSPIEFSKVYSGWQLVGRDEEQSLLEVMGAFVNHEIVDNMKKAFDEADFMIRAVEFRPISLTRLIREQGVGVDVARPYIALILDNESLDFLILRHGQLYFEYFNLWKDLRGEGREISLSDFRTVITRNLRQVLNYYAQHWQESLEEVVVVASGLGDEVKKIIKDNFSLSARELGVKFDRPVGGEWFTALGGAIRALVPRRLDRDISLLGSTTQNEYRREQIVSFVNFWRIMVPVTMILLSTSFLVSDVVIMRMDSDLEEQLLNVGSSRVSEFNALQSEAAEFNGLVALISKARPSESKVESLTVIQEVLNETRVTITSFAFSDYGAGITLVGKAGKEEEVLDFKRMLESNPRFRNVALPLGSISVGPQGVTFTMSFSITSLNTE